MMPIGNQKFGIPKKYQYQIGIWYFCPKFLGIFLVFCRNLEYGLLIICLNTYCFESTYYFAETRLNIGIFRQMKICLVFGFRGCYFIGISLVSVCHFPESDISSTDTQPPAAVMWGLGTFRTIAPPLGKQMRKSTYFLA